MGKMFSSVSAYTIYVYYTILLLFLVFGGIKNRLDIVKILTVHVTPTQPPHHETHDPAHSR